MLYQASFSRRLILLLVLILPVGEAHTSPLGDSYTASALDVVESYTDFPLTFDGNPETGTPWGLTRITETFKSFGGFAGGVKVYRPGGFIESLGSWAQNGHVIEMELANVDGYFISITPLGLWSVTFSDIDLDYTGPESGLRVVGIYFDLVSSTQELPYNVDNMFLMGEPIGIGDHPFRAADKVIYVTAQDAQFDNFGFAAFSGNKLTINVSAENHFAAIPLGSIATNLGLTVDPDSPPYIDILRIGVLVTGLSSDPIAGDYNRDGSVNDADYNIWKMQFGSAITPFSGADGSGNGLVDAADFTIWKDNYGATASTSAIIQSKSAISAKQKKRRKAGKKKAASVTLNGRR